PESPASRLLAPLVVSIIRHLCRQALKPRPHRGYRFAPIAVSVRSDRTYITPPDSAGVAISSSPIEFVAICLNSGPAAMTSISPSSFERYILPSAATGEALKP